MVYRKKLQYLIARRATLELETVLGEFWRRHEAGFADRDLPELERILLMEDLDLLEILLGKRPIPDGYNQEILALMMEFQPIRTLHKSE